MNPSPGAQLTDLLETLTAGGTPYKLTIQQILTLYHGSYLQIVNNLSDLANNLTARNNLQIPTGRRIIETDSSITFVNTGNDDPTSLKIGRIHYIKNTAATTVNIDITLPVMDSVTPGQKSIAVGDTIYFINTSVNPDTEDHPETIKDSDGFGIGPTIYANQILVCTLLRNDTSAGLWDAYVIGNASWYNVTNNDPLNYPDVPVIKAGAKTVNNLVTIATALGSIKDSGISAPTLDTLVTINSTLQTITSIPVSAASAVLIEAKILGKKLGAGDTVWAFLKLAVSRNGTGNVTQSGTTNVVENLPGAQNITATLDTGTQTVWIQVQGVGTDTYQWSCEYKTLDILD